MASWYDNVQYLANNVIGSGNETANNIQFYNNWLAAGRPTTQAEFQAWKNSVGINQGYETPTQTPSYGGFATQNEYNQYNNYVNQGILNGDGTLNMEWANDPANFDSVYALWTMGAGLGENDIHKGMLSSLGSVITRDATQPTNGLTLGGYVDYDNTPTDGTQTPTAGGQTVTPMDFEGQSVNMTSRVGTPFMDAYVRARDAAKSTGPVSGLFANELNNNG